MTTLEQFSTDFAFLNRFMVRAHLREKSFPFSQEVKMPFTHFR